MKFSIITVCFNAENHIEKTIESVLKQKFEDYEYIIVDGASTDGTCGIIEKYSKAGENCALKIRFVSEKDSGLYDAMNKGLKMAAGDYIEFLNAGDELFDENTLENIAGKIEAHEKTQNSAANTLFYGNIVYMNPDGSEDVRIYGESCGKPIYFATGDCVNHQAIFAARDTFGLSCDIKAGSEAENVNDSKAYPFNFEEFKICADRDWMMRATKQGADWIALNETVVKYDLADESISVRDKALLRAEEKKCLKMNYPLMVPVYSMFDFCRNNKTLAKMLHAVYEKLYIR